MLYHQFLDTRQLKLINDLNEYLDCIVQDSSLDEQDKMVVVSLREKLRTRKGIVEAT